MRIIEPTVDAWVWYGGAISLNFVNTRRNRERSPIEYLTDAPTLERWIRASELSDAPVDVDAAAWQRAMDLRETIDAGVRAVVAHQPFPREVAEVLNDWSGQYSEAPSLRVEHGTAHVVSTPDRVDRLLGRIAVDAIQLLGTRSRARLRICDGRECAGRFLDLSPGGRRRWCSMATCGNRSKAAAHRAKD
jgi:predicted RNA-binding Zn ribbon-like protein